MDFSLDRFYRLNRKAIIWIVLFGLIYLLRDFFTLIFLTFILGFFAIQAARFLSDRLRLGRGLAIILVYALIASSYVWLVYWIFPSVIAQMSSIQAKLPVIQAKLKDLPDELEKKYPNLVHLSGFDVESSLLTDGDVIDWTGFYQRLSQSWDSSSTNPRRRIMEMLPDSTRRLIQQAAAEQPAGLAAKPESSASVPSPADPNAPHQLQPANSLEGDASIPAATGPARAEKENQRDAQIIEALNQNVITRRDFYRPTDFRGILLPDAGRELLARNHAELTPGQVEKLNRLLIEATFPEIIVKRRYLTEEKIDKIINQYRTQLQDYMPSFAGQLFDFFVTSLLATLFSFLIAFDYTRLQREVQSLARSKLHDFFEEAGQPVVKFALSVGYGFQAQIFIAVVTVALLIPTLIILRIPSLALLTVITFLTGLVPVIGALIQG
ncbi:AI-2E family transporter, partial [Candidatus Sumerlaeota bacterium]|nr:AI-2E family transporter [Candidatus Sumerlaeota bacterium]